MPRKISVFALLDMLIFMLIYIIIHLQKSRLKKIGGFDLEDTVKNVMKR